MFNLFKKHRAFWTITLILLAMIAIFLPQIIMQLPWFGDGKSNNIISGLEVVLYCSQIVSAIFVIVGTIIAVWQYYLSSSKKICELQFSQVEKAIELSNYYKDNILDKYSYIKRVLVECGIETIMEEKRSSVEIKNFDLLEMKNIFTKNEIRFFEHLKDNDKFVAAVVKVDAIINGNTGKQSNELVFDFFRIVTRTLNNIEYFAMAFTHNTADESVIFQSIYPTYLEMCFIMYYFIACRSDPKVAKLYTNLAELYSIWKEKEKTQHETYNAQARKTGNKKGTVVEDSI